MTDKNVLSTIKTQWVILKDSSASIKDRMAAYGIINSINAQHEGEEGFTAVNPANTRYKAFADVESAQKYVEKEKAPQASEARPSQMTSSVPPSVEKFNKLVQNFEFKELSAEEQEAIEKKARKVLETKIICAKVSMEFAELGYDTAISVGQVTGLVLN